jgi:hypothetical protein
VSVSGNIIINNSGPGIYCSLEDGTMTVDHNEIYGNSGSGISIFEQTANLVINYNNLMGNTLYEIDYGDRKGLARPPVDATLNWWGTTDEAAIKEKIYDWEDVGSRGIVNYSPYLVEPVQIEEIS